MYLLTVISLEVQVELLAPSSEERNNTLSAGTACMSSHSSAFIYSRNLSVYVSFLKAPPACNAMKHKAYLCCTILHVVTSGSAATGF